MIYNGSLNTCYPTTYTKSKLASDAYYNGYLAAEALGSLHTPQKQPVNNQDVKDKLNFKFRDIDKSVIEQLSSDYFPIKLHGGAYLYAIGQNLPLKMLILK